MIEQLYQANTAARTGPQYRQITEEILKAEERLTAFLDEEGLRWLADLSDAYARREEDVGLNAFAAGFRMAAELAVDLLRGRNENQ